MINIGVQGASGRTGGLILSVLDEFSNLALSAALVSETSRSLGAVAKGTICYSSHVEDAVKSCDLLVDFSSPTSSVRLAHACALYSKPLLIATTGLSDIEHCEIAEASKRTPILLAPNTSLGVFALKELSLTAQEILGDSFDIEVSEIHHRMKKDAPSGTALYLSGAVAERSSAPLVYDRSGVKEVRKNDVGVTAIRGGDVVGEHTVYFIGMGERIELTHRVWDRKVFARGALVLAQKLLGRKAGLYSLDSSFMRN